MYFNDYRGCHGMMNMYQPSQELIELLIEAMKDEKADRAKYGRMMKMTDNKKVKRQIEFAYEDEGKHYKMFQEIYHLLTGQIVNIPLFEESKDNSLVKAIESSIDDELEAVELYRKIKAVLPNRQLKDMLFEIITDEQEHTTRLVYIYSMLHCKDYNTNNQMPYAAANSMYDNKDNKDNTANIENISNIDNLQNSMHKYINKKSKSKNPCSKEKSCESDSKKSHKKENSCKDDIHKMKYSKKRMENLW